MKKQHDIIILSKEQKLSAAMKIQEYVLENLDMEIGNLQSEIFVDFITGNIGAFYYNKAIADASSFMTEKSEDLYVLMKAEE